MTDPHEQERSELVNQLDELLGAGAVDVSDALEIAICAGLANRLGADPTRMVDVEAWRKGPGEPLLTELWQEASTEDLVEAIDGLLGSDAEDEEVEDAIFDFDDFVAAAVWCGRRDRVAAAAKQVAATIRMAPEVFEPLAPYGPLMARLRAVGEDLGLYDYWLAIADIDKADADN